MRIEKYIQMMDYALCDIIENGKSILKTQTVNNVETFIPYTTADEKLQRKNKVKARSTLMMGLPNEHQLKFNSFKDAKSLLVAIEKRELIMPMELILLALRGDGSKVANGYANHESKEISQKYKKEMNLTGNDSIAFDKTKVECYNCHKRGHFVRECRAPKGQDNRSRDAIKKTMPVETPNSSALVSCDGLRGYDWSDQAKKGPTNSALMAYSTKSASSSDSESKDKSNEVELESVRKHSDASIIEDWVSNDAEEEVENQEVKPSINRINFVKATTDNNPKEIVKTGEQPKQNTHMKRGNMSFLINYKEIDEGYVAFGGNPKGEKITGKGTKDETSGTLKSFISRVENLMNLRVKVIRCDNGTEFKNREINQFCKVKGSITTWEDLTTHFLAQFFPSGRTIKLGNDILMFQQHHGESLSESWTYFKDLLQKFLIMALTFGSKSKSFMSMSILSQDKPLTNWPVQQSEMTNKIDTVLKAITDRIVGALPRDTVKNPKLSTYPVLSTRSYLNMDPQCLNHIHSSINDVTIHPEQQRDSYDDRAKENKEEEKDSPKKSMPTLPHHPIHQFHSSLKKSSNSIHSSNRSDWNDYSREEGLEEEGSTTTKGVGVEYFDIFPTRSELNIT
nr:zinc finger, CCHC-type [Tanacetum cinerariifolium]